MSKKLIHGGSFCSPHFFYYPWGTMTMPFNTLRNKTGNYVFDKPQREVDRIFIHCSASNNPAHDDISVIRRWHKMDLGWSDVGYHYFIKKDGTLEIGRDLEKTPAAQRGHNVGTIAICLSGLEEEDFTEEQFHTLYNLCEEIGNQIPEVTFHGHCEVSDKTCPVFNYKKVLKLDSYGKMLTPDEAVDESLKSILEILRSDTDEIADLKKRVDALEKKLNK